MFNRYKIGPNRLRFVGLKPAYFENHWSKLFKIYFKFRKIDWETQCSQPKIFVFYFDINCFTQKKNSGTSALYNYFFFQKIDKLNFTLFTRTCYVSTSQIRMFPSFRWISFLWWIGTLTSPKFIKQNFVNIVEL